MASENLALIQPVQRIDNSLSSQLAYQEDTNLQFGCGPPQSRSVGDPGSKTTRELTGFIDDRYIQTQGPEFRRSLYGDAAPDRQDHQNRQDWNNSERVSNTPSGDGSDGDDDDEDDDNDDVNGLVAVDNNSNKNNSSNNSGHSTAAGDNPKAKNHLSSFGSSRGVMVNEGNVLASINVNNSMRASSSENHDQQGQGRIGNFQGPATIADPEGEMYYSHYLQGPDSSASGQKDMVDHGCRFSGRKDGTSYSNESGDSLRAILADPLTGALMDDAMILPCGHSFNSNGGIQHVIRLKACYTCSQPVSEDSVAPNLSLRAAVQAFRREEELQGHCASKKRKERFEQEKGSLGDSTQMDPPRSRGLQFPFSVTDRVIIKGNNRTPQRFVGREAVVTSQCLNGWYVVKTLDNAESVKLQYRSLSKVPDNINTNNTTTNPTPNPTSSSKVTNLALNSFSANTNVIM